MLDLKTLRTLQAVAETGSLTLAAQRLHLTQSALSHQVRELESRLKLTLLNRRARPLRLTYAGLRLAGLADVLLPQVDAVLEELAALSSGHAGRLYVTGECHSCLDWLLPRLREYRRQHPRIELDVSLSASLDPMPALASGALDLVLTPDRRELPGIAWRALFAYAMRAVVAPEHPLAGRARLDPQDLAPHTLLVYPVARERLDVFRRFLWPARVEPARVRRVDSSVMLLELAALGQGVAVLPDWLCARAAAEGRVRLLRLGRRGLRATLHAAVRAPELGLPHIADFLSLLAHQPGSP